MINLAFSLQTNVLIQILRDQDTCHLHVLFTEQENYVDLQAVYAADQRMVIINLSC